MKIPEFLRRDRRLSPDEALSLYELDLFALGEAADLVRREKYGNKTFFNINRHINPTNMCKDVCKFCAYSSHRKNPNPFRHDLDLVMESIAGAVSRGAKEVHVVGAHNPECDIVWYETLFARIKAAHPKLHLKALTAAEVHFLAEHAGVCYQEILDRMAAAGVDSMPGGGAEIFDESVREYICKGKVSSRDWLEIHRLWHRMGRQSNCTMLFGHVESREHRIDHMLRIRELQEETGGFNAFIPLVYQKENNFLKVEAFPSGQEILKTIAIARLVLDNVPHIKAYWVSLTMNLALVAQEFGADDIDGTIEQESIHAAAGAKSDSGMLLEDFIHQIKDSGFTPIERDSLYNEIREW